MKIEIEITNNETFVDLILQLKKIINYEHESLFYSNESYKKEIVILKEMIAELNKSKGDK